MQKIQTTRQEHLKDRVTKLIATISEGMYEREEIISVSILAALCGQNTFLYGPPGTAKSLISRRISCAFDNPAYFEYLMNRFSTPEEVFGPVSIRGLKEDRYTRKTDSYLPKADFAFLDEIWKSSPAILNTLLTLINERTFRNGETIEQAPLKALLAASNETPDINQGLEALYDRFIVRLMVPPIGQQQHFDLLLNSRPSLAEVNVPEELRIKPDEWTAWLKEFHSVALSAETLTIVHLIREELARQHASLNVYVSDRRWQRAAILMKAAAFFNGRQETNHSDALLLQHCLWTHEENRKAVMEIVENAVKASGVDSGLSLAEIDEKKDLLEREIKNELLHTSDVYKTEKIREKEFFRFNNLDQRHPSKEIFVPAEKIKSSEAFKPLDGSGNEIQGLRCTFDGQGTCAVESVAGRNIYEYSVREKNHYKPTVLFRMGDKKEGVNGRLVTDFLKSISEIRTDLHSILKRVTKRLSEMESEFASPFVPPEKTRLAIVGISEQIESLKLRIKDCERLEALCR